ncbi:hypothetical protein OG418_29585 [Streptomyces phaeochromogenes]|uniref:hypothetical protein n=1 Tax=Streptomyces phaeochromogenes TaxID=1923 RepID=UPI00324DA675
MAVQQRSTATTRNYGESRRISRGPPSLFRPLRRKFVEELQALETGAIVGVLLGVGERLLPRRAKDANGTSRFTLVEVAELMAPWLGPAQPTSVLVIADYRRELGLAE